MGRASLRRLVALRREDGGVVSILAAMFGVCLIVCTAFAVDLSSIYLARRTQQGALDIAAMAAASDLTRAEALARAALTQNGVPAPQTLKVTLGRYEADRGRAANGRFVAGGAPTNAVRLEMSNPSALYFSKAILPGGGPKLNTSATAANTRLVSFSVGSRLASLQGGVANALLSSLLGASVSLSVMDYNALADVKIDMPDFIKALGPRVGVTAGTYDQVLATSPTISQITGAIIDVLPVGSGAQSALASLIGAGADRRAPLARMISFGPLGKLAIDSPTGVGAKVSALDLLMTALGVSNGGRQVDVNLGLSVPGLLGLTASVTIGERPQNSPWFAMGLEGVSVRTAQTRVRLIAQVGGGGLLPPVVRLPIAIDVAAAEAKLTLARCGRTPRTDAQAELGVTPSLVELWVGEPRNLASWNSTSQPANIGPATVVDALLLSATAYSHVAASNMQPTVVPFNANEIRDGAVKTIRTTDALQTTLGSLTSNLAIQVRLLGLTLGTPGAVTDLLSRLLTPVGATLDPVVSSLLKLLGVGLGEADVSVRGIRCDGSALVG